jgi:DNA-binding PadR family transcriptional regulator
MEYVILGLLIIQRMTLYELNQAFKQGISMFYSASYGSLQVAVKNLLGKGLIVFEEKVEKGRNKKVYCITEEGRQAFYQWMLAEIPVNKLEVLALAKVYFLGLMDDLEDRRQIIQDILVKAQIVEDQLGALNERLDQLQISPEYQAIAKFQLKTLDYGRKNFAFSRAWFQELLDDLDRN